MEAQATGSARVNWWSGLPLRRLFSELIVVFSGVFAAFLLSAYQAEQQKEQQRLEMVRSVRADLAAYIRNGRDATQGFVNYFAEINRYNKAQISRGRLEQLPGIIFGDYWHLEGIHLMLSSGRLNDIDLALYRDLARFNTLHQNFLQMIEGYNQYQLQFLLPQLSQAPFFQPDGQLAAGYAPAERYPEQLAAFSQVTVQIATELLAKIDAGYPQLKPQAPSETPAE